MTELVPDRLTRLSPAEAIDALCTAYERVMGKRCDAPTLAIIVAQSALETGHWRSIHCFNFGNAKRGAGDKLYTMFRCNEIISGKVIWFDPPHPQTHFKAFETAADGAEHHLRFLAIDTTPDNGKPHRYARAWHAAENDDPVAFSRELSKAGYYTASVSRYTETLTKLFRQYLPQCRDHLAQRPIIDPLTDLLPEPDPIDRDRVLAAVAQTIDGQKRDFFADPDNGPEAA